MHPIKSNTTPDPHRWIVFLGICLAYFFAYFHRVSTSVIVPDLLVAFNTQATALGIMSSMYFYAYALEQPVVGYLTDRIGPRRVIGYWSIAATVGCIVFGLAPGIGWAAVGRTLIGLGVGGVYVPAIKAFSQWFRKKEFAFMIGLLMAVGNFGGMIATTPLAWAADSWGWRLTFFIIGGITLAIACFTLLMTRDYATPVETDPLHAGKPVPETPDKKHGIRIILASKQFWLIAIIFFGIYGTLVTFQGLWATPFLMTTFGIDRITASKLNMLIPIGVAVGSPAIGWLAVRLSLDKARILIVIILVYTLTWIGTIFYYEPLGVLGVGVLLLVMGAATGGFISMLWAYVREKNSTETLGQISGLLNPAPFFGIAVFQVITGAILDRSDHVADLYTVAGFKSAFVVCLAGIVVCLFLSLFLTNFHAQPRTTNHET
jgi:sugar phosphate permease